MNKKVITIIAVVVVAALVILAVIYAPSLMEFMLRMHQIPPH
jgi:hypothetical protein